MASLAASTPNPPSTGKLVYSRVALLSLYLKDASHGPVCDVPLLTERERWIYDRPRTAKVRARHLAPLASADLHVSPTTPTINRTAFILSLPGRQAGLVTSCAKSRSSTLSLTPGPSGSSLRGLRCLLTSLSSSSTACVSCASTGATAARTGKQPIFASSLSLRHAADRLPSSACTPSMSLRSSSKTARASGSPQRSPPAQ